MSKAKAKPTKTVASAVKAATKTAPVAAKPKSARHVPRRPFTTADERALRQHSRRRTPVSVIAREMGRTEGALRQQAFRLRFQLGHRGPRR